MLFLDPNFKLSLKIHTEKFVAYLLVEKNVK